MKINKISIGVFALLMLLSSSCKKDSPDEEGFSPLKPQEHKQNIENEGVEFVKNMSALSNLELYSVINEFNELLKLDRPDNSINFSFKTVLQNISKVSSDPQSNVNLNLLKGATPKESLSENFNEEVGIYTWNTESETWIKEISTSEITYKFKNSSGDDLSISMYEFTVKDAVNQDVDGFEVELPTSLKMYVKKGMTDLCAFNFTGDYYSDDTPKYLSETLNIEGYSLESILDLKKRENLTSSSSLHYKGKTIYAAGFNVAGKLNYSDIKTTVETDDMESQEMDLLSQDIVDNANAYFQIGNIKAGGSINAKGLIDQKNKTPEPQQTDDNKIKILNDNIKIDIKYADSKQIIAKGEFYMSEYSDEYYDYDSNAYLKETYTKPDMRMIFEDKSALKGDYFDNGFGKMIDEMNTVIQEMNKNYDLELDKL